VIERTFWISGHTWLQTFQKGGEDNAQGRTSVEKYFGWLELKQFNAISDCASVLSLCMLIPCLLYAAQQTEPSPCNLLTVKIIRMKNARKADLCKYLYYTLEHPHACKTTWNITKCHKHYRVFVKGEREKNA